MRVESIRVIEGSQNPAQMVQALRDVANEIEADVADMTGLGINSPVIVNGNNLFFNITVEGDLP